MSLILDAIKKSERERNKHRGPDLQSIHNSPAGIAGDRSNRSRWMLLLLALGILVLGVSWLWPGIKGELPSMDLPSLDVDSVHTTDGAIAADAPVVREPAVNADHGTQIASTHTVRSAPASSGDILPPRHLIQELWQLPADYQESVPALDFSFHVFSREPEKRTIIINGRRMREGQMVASGMRLRVITETGIILHYRDRFFHVDVIEKW